MEAGAWRGVSGPSPPHPLLNPCGHWTPALDRGSTLHHHCSSWRSLYSVRIHVHVLYVLQSKLMRPKFLLSKYMLLGSLIPNTNAQVFVLLACIGRRVSFAPLPSNPLHFSALDLLVHGYMYMYVRITFNSIQNHFWPFLLNYRHLALLRLNIQ